MILFSIAGFSFLFAVMDPVDNSIKYVFHAFGVADLIFQTIFAVYTFSSFDCVSYQQPTFFVKSVSERERERERENRESRGKREEGDSLHNCLTSKFQFKPYWSNWWPLASSYVGRLMTSPKTCY